MFSLVIPIYRNEQSVASLLAAASGLASDLPDALEVVFVVDGSPDASHARLAEGLRGQPFRSRLILLSRNFGAFNAIRVGLGHAAGPYFAVMAADLQEPPELVREFFRLLAADEADVVVGRRVGRADPAASRVASGIFWSLYRRLVQKDMPAGGVDIFGCNLRFRNRLLALTEANSSLVGQIFWLGFRRREVPYTRRAREHGRSAWTLRKRLRYLADSVFSFTDLPIRFLGVFGLLGLLLSAVFATVVVFAQLSGVISVPGYSATVLLITFFGALNCFGLGVIGSYVWRAYENTKQRPLAEVMSVQEFTCKGGERA